MPKKQTTGNSIPFPDEAARLAEIKETLKLALRAADNDVKQLDKEYMDAKRYMVEYRGETDPHEMFQNELLLKQTDRIGAFAVGTRDKIAKLQESPYFARIDFQSNGTDKPETYYIGRFAFSYHNKPLIFDWRAPVSGMFYDYEVGPAAYDAPMGRIRGELTRKRQFKIKNGIMEYALESAAHVQDDILQQELAHTSDEKMKSIIGTIQKEQNKIIRNENTGALIIQGVAGSGKTSIALHRVAYLLYRFKEQLNAKNVTILSPNKVFGDYISNVIPELGEEPIYELDCPTLAKIHLEKVIDFAPERDPLAAQDDGWAERVAFKSTRAFLKCLDNYIANMPDRIFMPVDYTFGRFIAKAEWLKKRFFAYRKHPVKQRLSMVADDSYHQFQNENSMQDDLPTPKTILKSLSSMLTIKTTLALYKDFFQAMGKPQLFVMAAKKTLEWADVFPFLYLHAAFEGIKESRRIKHLVIDEMQDYTPTQFAVINRLFPCQKTILGDFGQSLNPYHAHTLADIQQLYEGAQLVELNKSYRSTYEIMTFAKQIQPQTPLEPIERHGRQPQVIACKSWQDELNLVQEAIQEFKESGNTSLGIILKTRKTAKAVFDILSGSYDVNLITPESTSFAAGVSITSIQMAKGLEFDQVIIPQVNRETYCTDIDRSLLYIACTRAMHRLTLSYSGTLSNLITTEGC